MKRIFVIFWSLFLLISCTQQTIIEPLDVVATWTDATFYRGDDGTISLTITGGIPPYHVTYNGKPGDYWKYDVEVGYWIITVTDNAGNSRTIAVDVKGPSMKSSLLGSWEAPTNHTWTFLSDNQFKEYDSNGRLSNAGYFSTDDDGARLTLNMQSGASYKYHNVTFVTKDSFFVTTADDYTFGISRE